jgi:hypothetical protein
MHYRTVGFAGRFCWSAGFACQLCLAVILAALDDLRHIGLVAG